MDRKSWSGSVLVSLSLALALATAGCQNQEVKGPKQVVEEPPPPPPATPAPAAPAPAAPEAAAAAPAAPEAPSAPVSAEALAEAKNVFTTRCGSCHGAGGAGDGAAAAALTPKPRNFVDKEWQKTVTDSQLEKAIKDGGPAVGKSPLMPPNSDLKPEVIAGLRQHIRDLAK